MASAYFLIRIVLGGDLPPGTQIGKDVPEKEMRLDHDPNAQKEWEEGDDVSLPFVHETLIPGGPYVINVRACTNSDEVGDCTDWGAVSTSEVAPAFTPLQPLPPTCPWQWPDALQIEWAEPCMSGAPQTQCDCRFSKFADMSDFVQVPDEDLKTAVESRSVVVGNLSYTTEYFFQWRIANCVGWSPWSEVSPAQLTKASRPVEPENLQTAEVQKEAITMRWDAPGDHGAAVTGYEIILVDGPRAAEFQEVIKKSNACNYTEGEEYNAEAADAAAWKVLNTIELKSRAHLDVADASDPNSAVHTFSGLLGGIGYSAVVRAYNKCGWSDWSDMLSVVTPTAEPERCPQAVMLDATQESVAVEYRMPYDNGAPITRFVFNWSRLTGPKDRHKARTVGGRAEDHRYSASGTVTVDVAPGGPMVAPAHGIGGSDSVTLTGLEPGTEYDVQYCAENKNGFGPMSYTTKLLTAPGRPDAPGKVRHSPAAEPDESQGTSVAPLPDQASGDSAPPTVCFARTSRLAATEVVHVRPPGHSRPGNPRPLMPSIGSSRSNGGDAKIHE